MNSSPRSIQKSLIVSDVHATSIRLPVELATVLKNYTFVTGVSGNEVIARALTAYLTAPKQRQRMVSDAFAHVLEQHKAALDKLEKL